MKILSLLISISLFSQEKVDYVIIQNPQNLLIYNKYQQVIEKNEQVRFRDYSPFKILERNMQFNDQINYGMKVEYEGEQYYIGKNEKGHLLNLKDAGKIDVIENAEEIDRQIELLSNQSL
ncbi:MAG: hypothetical protein KDD94_15060, partial [Calditrichaeota bacterium]|nr:hypothetical protein [Calditrichota bacterium]